MGGDPPWFGTGWQKWQMRLISPKTTNTGGETAEIDGRPSRRQLIVFRRKAGPFAAEQPTDVSYLSQVVRCAPVSDEAPQGPSWSSANRRTRRPNFHDERPATPRCLLALPTQRGPDCHSASSAEAVRKQCGSSAEAVRKSCGSSAEVMRNGCGGNSEQLRKSCGGNAE